MTFGLNRNNSGETEVLDDFQHSEVHQVRPSIADPRSWAQFTRSLVSLVAEKELPPVQHVRPAIAPSNLSSPGQRWAIRWQSG